MKKYRLKQWYPSLPPVLKTGMIVEFDGINSIMGEIRYNHCFTDYSCGFNGLELKCEQFWELIEEKEPLFITEDGVEIFAGDNFIMVEDDFTKHKLTAYNVPYTEDFKRFKHESNADEYIWKNKPLFITEDGVKMLDRDSIVWMVRNKNLEKIKIHSIHLNEYDFEHKVFFHESNADEYIWRNKRVFSYKDIQNYGVHPVNMIRVEQLAKERSKE